MDEMELMLVVNKNNMDQCMYHEPDMMVDNNMMVMCSMDPCVL